MAFRNVLKEWTRDRVPNDWAVTQNNLGSALVRLGERESGTAQLEEAIVAFGEALKENSRDFMPLDWAMIKITCAMRCAHSGNARAEPPARRSYYCLSRGAEGMDA